MDNVEHTLLGVFFNSDIPAKWGPCFCGGSEEEPCESCINANEIEAAGLDWDIEFQKWEIQNTNPADQFTAALKVAREEMSK